nr:sulfatase-like hydrolase/transferase [Bryobacterales bacterium]
IDWNVGRLLDALREMGKDKDTIVVYFGDNGPNSWRWNGGMKGRKGSLDEGGLRVPCLMRWTGHIPADTRVSSIAGAIDLLPTLAGLAGVPLTKSKPLDGLNLQPLLLGKGEGWPDRRLFSMQNRRASVRTQRYRLDAEGKLYDLVGDPGQTRDIASQQPAIAAELRSATEQWQREMLLALGEDTRPFPVGYAENTLLPARDGVPVGSIQRSSRHPNCSFFTNWTSTSDAMEWNVDVGRGGRYVVTVYYTCPEAALGSQIALRSGDQEVSAVIQEAHDPPLEGAAEDRVPRIESYVKAFRPMELGEIVLTKGRGALALRALKVASKQVADVRQIALRYRGEAIA